MGSLPPFLQRSIRRTKRRRAAPRRPATPRLKPIQKFARPPVRRRAVQQQRAAARQPAITPRAKLPQRVRQVAREQDRRRQRYARIHGRRNINPIPSLSYGTPAFKRAADLAGRRPGPGKLPPFLQRSIARSTQRPPQPQVSAQPLLTLAALRRQQRAERLPYAIRENVRPNIKAGLKRHIAGQAPRREAETRALERIPQKGIEGSDGPIIKWVGNALGDTPGVVKDTPGAMGRWATDQLGPTIGDVGHDLGQVAWDTVKGTLTSAATRRPTSSRGGLTGPARVNARVGNKGLASVGQVPVGTARLGKALGYHLPGAIFGGDRSGLNSHTAEALVAGAIDAVVRPKQTYETTKKDWSERYGKYLSGQESGAQLRARMRKHGWGAYAFDAAAAAVPASRGLTVGLRTIGTATPKAAGLKRFVDAPRPDLYTGSGGKGRRQYLSRGVVGIAAQRGVDRYRLGRTRNRAEHPNKKVRQRGLQAQAQGQVLPIMPKRTIRMTASQTDAPNRFGYTRAKGQLVGKPLEQILRLTKTQRFGRHPADNPLAYLAIEYGAKSAEHVRKLVSELVPRMQAGRVAAGEGPDDTSTHDTIGELEEAARNADRFSDDFVRAAEIARENNLTVTDLDPKLTKMQGALRSARPAAMLHGIERDKIERAPVDEKALKGSIRRHVDKESRYERRVAARDFRKQREPTVDTAPVATLQPLAQTVRADLGPDSNAVQRHVAAIQERGKLDEPVVVEYDPDTGFGVFAPGSGGLERIQAAKQAGLADVPIKVIRTTVRPDRQGAIKLDLPGVTRPGVARREVTVRNERIVAREGKPLDPSSLPPVARGRHAMLKMKLNRARLPASKAKVQGEIDQLLRTHRGDKPATAWQRVKELEGALRVAEERGTGTNVPLAELRVQVREARNEARALERERAPVTLQAVDETVQRNLPEIPDRGALEREGRLRNKPYVVADESSPSYLARVSKAQRDADYAPSGYMHHRGEAEESHIEHTRGTGDHAPAGHAATKYANLGRGRFSLDLRHGLGSAWARNVKNRFLTDLIHNMIDQFTPKVVYDAMTGKALLARNLTRDEVRSLLHRGALTKDYVVVHFKHLADKGRRAEDDPSIITETLIADLGSELETMLKASDKAIGDPDAKDFLKDLGEQRGYYIMDRPALEELTSSLQAQSIAARMIRRFGKSLPSRWILGTNPSWLVLQVVNNSLLATMAGINPLDWIRAKPLMNELKAKHPKQYELLVSRMGAGALETEQNIPKFGARATPGGKLEGYDRIYEAWKGTMASKVFNLEHLFRGDVGNNWLFRSIVASNTAKVLRARQLNGSVQRSITAYDRFFSGMRGADADHFAKMLSDPRMLDEIGRATDEVLGNYSRYNAFERRYLESNLLFYGFIRFSVRFALYTLPFRHPAVAAILGKLAQFHEQEVRRMLSKASVKAGGPKVGPDDPLPFGAGANWYRFEKGKLAQVSSTRINPILNSITGSALNETPGALVSTLSPWVAEVLGQVYGVDAFRQKRFYVGGKPQRIDVFGSPERPGSPELGWNSLGELGTRAKILASRAMGYPMPTRVLADARAQGRVPSAESIPFVAEKYVKFSPEGKAAGANRRRRGAEGVPKALVRGAFDPMYGVLSGDWQESVHGKVVKYLRPAKKKPRRGGTRSIGGGGSGAIGGGSGNIP